MGWAHDSRGLLTLWRGNMASRDELQAGTSPAEKWAERGVKCRRSLTLLSALAVLGACGKIDDGAGFIVSSDGGAIGSGGGAARARAGAADSAGAAQGGQLSEGGAGGYLNEAGGAGGYMNEAGAAGDRAAGGQTTGDQSPGGADGGESQACPTGYFAHANGAAGCRPWTDCKPGEFVLHAGDASSDRVCAACQTNTFNALTNAATCKACEVGTFAPQTGAYACNSWTRLWQFGTIYEDNPIAVATDATGNAYVVGTMNVTLCATAWCRIDAFVRKYDAQGQVWMLQLGAENAYNFAYGAAVDTKNNLYVARATADQTSPRALLSKYDGDGNELWTLQLGPANWVSGNYGVATDTADNAYWGGPAGYDVSIRKFAADGAELWTRQVHSGDWTRMRSLSTDAGGNLYILGSAQENSVWHGFLRKYNALGEEQWINDTYLEGSGWYAAAADAAGNVYVAGGREVCLDPNTASSMSKTAGQLRKYDSSGAMQWSRELASPYVDGFDWWHAVSVDSHGDVYVTGDTDGALLQLPHPLNSDALIRKYDASGAELWTKELVASGAQVGTSISVAHDGRVFVTGSTSGVALPGQVDAGSYDGFLVVYEPL